VINQRTGFMLGAGFLERDGFEFHAKETEAVVRTLALAAGEVLEAADAGWARLALFFDLYQRKNPGNDLTKSRFVGCRCKLGTPGLPVQALDLITKNHS
jgi:hypothetical protein